MLNGLAVEISCSHPEAQRDSERGAERYRVIERAGREHIAQRDEEAKQESLALSVTALLGLCVWPVSILLLLCRHNRLKF